jgi:hypothetical protein
MVCDLVEARYTKYRNPILKRANLRLEKLRVLFRLCNNLHLISYKTYEHGIRQMNEIGKMLGGWIKQGEQQ